jgi:succinate-semialdehyde dehydrogenase/glutarate-semialdehyde dehydrogenase
MGPLISRSALKKITAQVEDALSRGATVLAGGYPLDGPGYFYPPTLLIDVPAEARVLQEEVFGPVLPVIVYDDVDTAIAQINETNLGLTASIFGPLNMAQAIARQITSGSVSLNGLPHMNYGLPQVPWVGWGRSGPGVSHGEAGLLALTQPQIITLEARAHKQSWFYTAPPHVQNPALPSAMARLLGAGSVFSTLWALPSVMIQAIKSQSSEKL